MTRITDRRSAQLMGRGYLQERCSPSRMYGSVETRDSFGAGGSFLRFVLSERRSRSVLVLGLLLGSAMLNGFSIALLLPLLQLIGLPGVAADQGARGAWIHTWLDTFGVPFNLSSVLLLFLGVSAAQALTTRWQSILNAELQADLTENLRNRLHAAITYARWLYLIRSRRSDLLHAMCDDLGRVSAGVSFLPRLLNAAALLIVYVGVSLWISPVITGVVLAGVAVFWPLWARQGRLAHGAGSELSESSREFYGRLTDHLAGIKELKCLGAEEQGIAAFRELTHRMKSAHLSFVRVQADTGFIHSLGTAALLCGLVWLAIGALRLPAAQLVLLVYLFTRITPRIQEIQTCRQHLLQMLPAYASLMHLQERCEASREPLPLRKLTEKGLRQQMELRCVSFRYDAADEADATAETTEAPQWALREVSLTIPARSTTAIVGPSGAGKSTLADILMGLLVPNDGVVAVDGHVLDDESRSAWRRCIGYVPQDTFLLHDTVRENLAWADPTADESDLWRALRLAAADTLVRTLPEGLDTVLGDRGVRLSGGERQRIALARALLRRPSVLILDEATSALDSENQLRIQQTIERLSGELTLILIAHRFSTLRGADQIVVLDGGKVVEIGGLDSLMERHQGRFRALVQADSHAI